MNNKTQKAKCMSWALLLTLSLTAGLAQAQTTQSQTTVITKNAQGQIASATDAMGNTVSYTYDALGNLVQTNAAGSITALQYDLRGNKIAMQDPAMGSWTYSYNAFGELVSQRDSLNQTTTLAYDVLGRMTKRTEPDLVSDWSYDTKFDSTACGLGKGKLCEAKSDNGYRRAHTYDSLGRPSSTATVLDNAVTPAVVSETYDPNTGRVASKTWPTGYQASYSYSALGYLTGVTGGGTNGFSATQSYQVLGMNAQGQITQYKTGNNVTTVTTYDPLVQRQVGQVVTTDGQSAGNVLNQAYRFDALGNLLARLDNTPGVGIQESFSYDSLNRLTTASILGGAVSPPTTTEVMYDQRGNISYKSDVGRYWYDTARPNRMTNVTLETAAGATVPLTGTRALSYAFDDSSVNAQSLNGTTVGNGNLQYTVSQDTVNGVHTVRYESYTSFNMPGQIAYGNFITNTSSTADRTLGFVYGPEHQRIKQSVALTSNGTSSYFSGNTWYLNGEDSLGLSYEKEVRANGTTENKHYLSAGGVTFALFTSRTGTLNGLSATTTSYFHQDQMSSIAAITDETGAVTERLAYDPWGKRRFISSTAGLPDTLDAITGLKTDRGYTMHEHLDEVGIIHMNGRIYDPLMARFMSADPIVQSPDDLRSFNRYSYVWNNPMRMFDPTGFEGVISSYNYSTRTNESYNNTSHSSSIQLPVGHWDYSAPPSATTTQRNQDFQTIQAASPNGNVLAIFNATQSLSGDPYGTLYGALPAELRYELRDLAEKLLETPNPVSFGLLGVVGTVKKASALKDEARSVWGVLKSWLGLEKQVVKSLATAQELNQIAHVFPRVEKNLDALVKASGSELNALRDVQSAANKALAEGQLVSGQNGILPGKGLGAVLNVNGVKVQLIGGRIRDGAVALGSFVGL
jgi:RHS repeat-associated protein